MPRREENVYDNIVRVNWKEKKKITAGAAAFSRAALRARKGPKVRY